MLLDLKMTAGPTFGARPVIKLAAGTLLHHMDRVDPRRAFRELDDFGIAIHMIRFEQVGADVPMQSPDKPGRVGHRKAEGLLTTDIHYNEIGMVYDRVARDEPGGRDMPASRDYLDTFAERLATAVAPLVAWCDRKDAWADRAHFMEHWDAAHGALADGTLMRPAEFTKTPTLRDALDACWALVDAEPLESERFEPLAEAYFLLRDAGWDEAEYAADPSQAPGSYGQPTKVANADRNIASAAPPDDRVGYSFV
ncbi:MAG: hypothetical protein AAGD40_11665 [Pseudomonadota bacterium]